MRRIKLGAYPALALAAALLGCAGEGERAGGERSLLRTLTGDEIAQVLTGNTLIGRDGEVPFWMHYPSPDTVWGLASNGDVDVGRWWVDGNRYCRAWRHWRDGQKQCWLFASDGSAKVLWIEPNGRASGESAIQAGNSIGRVGRPQLVANLIGSDVAEITAPYGEEVPVDATGTILLTSFRVRAGDGSSQGIDAGSPGRGSDPGGNAGGSGGSGSGSSSGGSGGAGTSGGSSGGGSTGGGPGSSGGDDGKGKSKGSGKGKGGEDDD